DAGLDRLTYISGGNGCFSANVSLPHGAKVQVVNFWYGNQGAIASVLGFSRARLAQTGSETQLFQTVLSDAKKQGGAALSASLAVIDNQTYSYRLSWCTLANTIFYGARIRYTYKSAGS